MVAHAGMGTLRALWLEDNPIATARLYRIDVLACFPDSQRLLLDGRPSQRSETELAALRAQVIRPSRFTLSRPWCEGALGSGDLRSSTEPCACAAKP